MSAATIEINATAKALNLAIEDTEKLRESAAALQAEAIRAILAAMSARAMAERLSVLSQVEARGE